MNWLQLYQSSRDRYVRLTGSIREFMNGAGPFVFWSILFFGGVWFPATPFLKYFFEGVAPTTEWLERTDLLFVTGFFVLSFVFWTWTNLAGICLLASMMGEVSRGWKEPAFVNQYRAITRGFYVYLFVLLSNLAVVGNIIYVGTPIEAQALYIRMAVLSSIFCFAASYSPPFFERLIEQVTFKYPEKQIDAANNHVPPITNPR